MRKLFYTLCILFPAANSIYAQPGSVELKDGAGTPISVHASVTEAYGAIPATLTQAYIIEIGSSYTGVSETYPILFTAKTGASATNTITLRPAAGVTSVLIQATMSGNEVILLDNADYVVIDGRPGGTGTGGVMSISNLGTTSSSNTIELQNGACFNTIMYCTIMNATTSSAGRGILLGTSASNPTGNSDNLVKYCVFPSGRYKFNSNGTSTNPNTRNTIFGCNFQNMIFAGVWGQGGTGKMRIDSCTFSCNTASGGGLFYGILFDSQNDTVVITNNRMFDLQNGSVGTMRYIHIRSVVTGGTNYTDINNNFISIMTGNTNITNMGGIEYSGSNPTYGRVVHNTIRIGSTLTSGGTSGNVGSSALLFANSSASSSFEVKNNIFINERTGGTTGLQHVALAATNISPAFDLDFNTYNSVTGNLTRWGTGVYTSISAYQAAVPGNEQSTNAEPVQLVSANDLHLSGTSLGNYALGSLPLPGITTDIDNEVRGVSVYRGADETAPALPPFCSGAPDPAAVTVSTDTLCAGDTAQLSLSGLTNLGHTLQWQSSTDGIIYTSIPGATDTSYSETIGSDTWYRNIITCVQSGVSDTVSAPVVAAVNFDAVTVTVTDDTVCTGDMVHLSLNGLPPVDLTLQWQSSADGTVYSNIPGATGTMFSEVISADTWYQSIVACASATLSDTVSAPMIVAGMAPSGGSISETHVGMTYSYSVSGLTGDYTYFWDFGDGMTSADSSPVHTYAANGIYMVSVIVSNDCGSDTLTYTTSITLGWADAGSGHSVFMLFPNPATNQFKISGNVQAEGIYITDVSGRVLWTQGSPVTLPLDLSAKTLQLGAGMYLVRIETAGHDAVLRLVIE